MGFIKHTPPAKEKGCNSPEHDPPGMIVLQPGTHVWQCPCCGQKTTITVQAPRMKAVQRMPRDSYYEESEQPGMRFKAFC